MDTGQQNAGRHLDVLDRAECLALLGTEVHGRLGYCDRHLPHIEVVNFVLDGEDVVIRMNVGNKSAAVARGGSFAFEVDRIDDTDGTGWNVTITGPVTWVTDPDELDHLSVLLRCSAPGERPHVARIRPAFVFGRRVRVDYDARR